MKNFFKKPKGRDLTEGSILKALLAVALPTIVANLLQTAYQLTDAFWVGRISADAVAAVSIAFPFIFLMISLGAGLAIAGSVLVAQHTGRKNRETVNHVAAQTYIMMIAIALILSVVGYIITPTIVRLTGADAAVNVLAIDYLRVTFVGMIFLFGYFVFQALMRGVGDAATPVYIVFGTVILNLILDPLFINGWGPIPAQGVRGAAIATIGTQGLATLIGTAILLSGRFDIHIRRKDLKPDLTMIKNMFKLGWPASLEQSTRALGLTIMTFLVSAFGTTIIASYGIGVRVLSFVIIPALAIAIACSTLVGQNMGAGKLHRAEKSVQYAAIIGFVSLTVIGLIIFLFAAPISAFFVPGQPDIISESAVFIRIMAFTFGFIALQQALIGAFQGSGSTGVALTLALVRLWIVQFPVAYVLSRTSLGPRGIWYAFPITNIAGTIISYAWFARGTWKRETAIDMR